MAAAPAAQTRPARVSTPVTTDPGRRWLLPLSAHRSFVREITSRADDAAIVTAVIAMAHSLKLKVIAEGVENQEALTWLHERDCDEVQGYHFSKPVPAEAAGKLLTASAARG